MGFGEALAKEHARSGLGLSRNDLSAVASAKSDLSAVASAKAEAKTQKDRP